MKRPYQPYASRVAIRPEVLFTQYISYFSDDVMKVEFESWNVSAKSVRTATKATRARKSITVQRYVCFFRCQVKIGTPKNRHPGCDFFFWAQFSRELARLYEYSYRPCSVPVTELCTLLYLIADSSVKKENKGSMWY